ncbi:MAG: winged helix-turn-helix domain-containing tetratricopeptide repeat protein, partial [Hyphomicrobiales bacterium]
MIYRFAPFELNTDAFELKCDGELISAEPQTLLILIYLLEQRHRMVSKTDLLDEIWQGRAISDWAVSAGIKSVRQVLGDTATERKFLRTVHGKGFRFVGQVSIAGDTAPVPQSVTNHPSLAVIPFENLSPPIATEEDAQRDYFADGISEDLLTDLSKIPELKISSRNACFAIKKQRLEVQEIGQKLNVDHVLEGSIRQQGGRLRINVQLSETLNGRQIWAERFEGSSNETFALQDELNAKIIASLQLRLTMPKARRGTTSHEAYDQCLRGRAEYYRYTPIHMAKALTFFENATRIDPNYSDAFAYQSYCRTAIFVFALPGSDNNLDTALSLADRAILLDKTSAVARARRGWVLGYENRPEEAIASFEAAIKLDPENAEVFHSYGETLNRLGQADNALPLLDRALGFDSFVPPSWIFPKAHSYT